MVFGTILTGIAEIKKSFENVFGLNEKKYYLYCLAPT